MRTLVRDISRWVPQPARARLYAVLPWRPGRREIPVDRLLLGLQNRVSASQFAAAHDDPLWPSTPVSQGPHAQLLRISDGVGTMSNDAILATRYVTLARRCISANGFYFTATDDAGIVEVARNFISRHRGEPAARLGSHQTPAGAAIRVAPIRWSDCYQVLDGHHRVASAAVRGDLTVRAQVKWIPVITPAQAMLLQVWRREGKRVLHQPVELPEVSAPAWRSTGSCPERLAAMTGFLADRGLVPSATTYLDVSSRYGWFVSQMESAGYEAEGVEDDPISESVGRAVYRLGPGRLHIANPAEFLAASTRQWDVVSCFGLLDRWASAYGAGRAADLASTVELARLMDRATGQVLLLDAGSMSSSGGPLADRDREQILRSLRENTSFEEVVDLGPGSPGSPPAGRIRGHHLFVCLRQRAR